MVLLILMPMHSRIDPFAEFPGDREAGCNGCAAALRTNPRRAVSVLKNHFPPTEIGDTKTFRRSPCKQGKIRLETNKRFMK